MRSFNNNDNKIYETEQGEIKLFEFEGESIALIFFKESEDLFYQEHVEFFTSEVEGNYKIGKAGWKIKDVFFLNRDEMRQYQEFLVWIVQDGQEQIYYTELEGGVIKTQEKILDVPQLHKFIVFHEQLFLIEESDNTISIYQKDLKSKATVSYLEL